MRGHAPAGKSMNAPLFVFTQQLNAELYAAAFAMWEGHLSLLHSRSVRMVLCWAVALVLIASIPAVARMSGDWFLLAALAMGAMGASFYFWRMHPAAMLQKGRMLFLGAPLLHEKFTHTFYEDRVESESEKEWMCQYYTDFTQCLEGRALLVLCGGSERGPLILDKAQLHDGEEADVRAFLKRVFPTRYWRLGASGDIE